MQDGSDKKRELEQRPVSSSTRITRRNMGQNAVTSSDTSVRARHMISMPRNLLSTETQGPARSPISKQVEKSRRDSKETPSSDDEVVSL